MSDLVASPVVRLVVSHLATIVGFVMAMVLVARSEQQKRPTGSTMAWVLIIVLVPYVGVPLYLIFGGRKIKERSASKQRLYTMHATPNVEKGTTAYMLCASGAPEPTKDNRVEMLETGELAYAAVVEIIEQAKRSIHVSTLIFAGDEVGLAISDLLEKKARAGVEVRVLVDDLFRFRSNRAQIERLRDSGARVAWFMPVWSLPFRNHANLRLHRKAITVDGTITIVGGMNLAREYMGPTPIEGRWRDLSARVTGPAVDDVELLFEADWAFAAHVANEKRNPLPGTHDSTKRAGEAEIQVVGSGPDVPTDPIYDAFLSSIFGAKRRLWIATPYFVPDEALARAIVLAVRRGVDVHIVVPQRSNHPTADLAGGSYLREIAAAGGRIHCFVGAMMHAKIVVVDDSLGVLGSANMDMRSLFLDYEIALFFTSRREIEGLESWIESILPQCVDLAPAGRVRRIAESAARLIAPLE